MAGPKTRPSGQGRGNDRQQPRYEDGTVYCGWRRDTRRPGGHSGFGAGRGLASRGSSIPGKGPPRAGPRAEAALIALAGAGGWPCSCERPRRPEVLGVGAVYAGSAAMEKATEAAAQGRGLEAQTGWRSCGHFGVAQTGPLMSTAAGAGIRVPGPQGATQRQGFRTAPVHTAEGLGPATRLAKFNRFQPGTRKIRPVLFVRERGRLSNRERSPIIHDPWRGPAGEQGWGSRRASCEADTGSRGQVLGVHQWVFPGAQHAEPRSSSLMPAKEMGSGGHMETHGGCPPGWRRTPPPQSVQPPQDRARSLGALSTKHKSVVWRRGRKCEGPLAPPR